MKLFDHKYKKLLPIDSIGWTFRDVIGGKYDDIEIIRPTGFFGKREVGEGLWVEEEIYQYDIIICQLKSGKIESVEGEVVWDANIGQFHFKRFDNGNVVWLNGLYNIEITGNNLEK